MKETFVCASEEETKKVAAGLAARLEPGDTVLLSGEMGAGKSVFARAVGQALSVTDPMTSPTFTILNIHEGRMPIYHFDFYRLSGEEELLAAGLDEFLPPRDGVALVEWPEIAESVLPDNAWHVRIETLDPESRRIVYEQGRTTP